MTDIFSGDPKIILTPYGANLDYEGGQPVMDQGMENQALLSLFTAPVPAGTPSIDPIMYEGIPLLPLLYRFGSSAGPGEKGVGW